MNSVPAVVVGGAETLYLFVLLVIFRDSSMLLRAALIHSRTGIHPSVSQSGCYMKQDFFFIIIFPKLHHHYLM